MISQNQEKGGFSPLGFCQTWILHAGGCEKVDGTPFLNSPGLSVDYFFHLCTVMQSLTPAVTIDWSSVQTIDPSAATTDCDTVVFAGDCDLWQSVAEGSQGS